MGVGDVERSTVAVDKNEVAVDCGVVCSSSVVFRSVVVGGIDVDDRDISVVGLCEEITVAALSLTVLAASGVNAVTVSTDVVDGSTSDDVDGVVRVNVSDVVDGSVVRKMTVFVFDDGMVVVDVVCLMV